MLSQTFFYILNYYSLFLIDSVGFNFGFIFSSLVAFLTSFPSFLLFQCVLPPVIPSFLLSIASLPSFFFNVSMYWACRHKYPTNWGDSHSHAHMHSTLSILVHNPAHIPSFPFFHIITAFSFPFHFFFLNFNTIAFFFFTSSFVSILSSLSF